jgi:hypothetical protein
MAKLTLEDIQETHLLSNTLIRATNIVNTQEPVEIKEGWVGTWKIQAITDKFCLHATDSREVAIKACKDLGLKL